MVKASSGDRSPLLLKSPRRCCRGGEGFFKTIYFVLVLFIIAILASFNVGETLNCHTQTAAVTISWTSVPPENEFAKIIKGIIAI